MPEYPRLFPNFEPSENYSISVTVADSQSNTKTYTQKFSYLPNNLVQLHNLRTLSVSSPLKTTDGVPLRTCPLTFCVRQMEKLLKGSRTQR